jgi:hypothetical protein
MIVWPFELGLLSLPALICPASWPVLLVQVVVKDAGQVVMRSTTAAGTDRCHYACVVLIFAGQTAENRGPIRNGLQRIVQPGQQPHARGRSRTVITCQSREIPPLEPRAAVGQLDAHWHCP